MGFWCRDLLSWLVDEYGDKDYANRFTVTAAKAYKDGDRYLERPHQANHWLHLQREHGNAAIAAIQAFTDATLVNGKGGKAHPVQVALLNADREVCLTVHALYSAQHHPLRCRLLLLVPKPIDGNGPADLLYLQQGGHTGKLCMCSSMGQPCGMRCTSHPKQQRKLWLVLAPA